MNRKVNDEALDHLFRKARTLRKWIDKPVGEDLLRAAWELARMGPTSANCSPARIVFAVSPKAKARLEPCLAEGNVEQTMAAPATAIIGCDLMFCERMSELFPQTDARSWFVGNEPLIQATAFRNGSLQGAYFILAARALGLDCGPMSGFDNDKVDREFFPGETVKSNFLCNLGYGDPASVRARGPRLSFDDACAIA